MKILPYKNVFETDILDAEEYNNFHLEQRNEFVEELINEPTSARTRLNEYGEKESLRGPTSSYYNDVISLLNSSKYTGYPTFKVDKDAENTIKMEIDNQFMYGWESFHHHYNEDSLDPIQFEKQRLGWTLLNDKTIVSEYNSYGFVGKYSAETYNDYMFDVRCSSTDNDNNRLIVIIGYVIDANGNDYTLSAIRNNDSSNFTWRLVYNYMKDDEWVVVDKSDIIPRGLNWSSYEYGTRIQVKLVDSQLSIITSLNDSDVLLEESRINVDISKDRRLKIFNDKRMIGVGCHSQALTTFDVIDFVEYGETFYNYLERNITILLRGSNFDGRHLITKQMSILDRNKLLLYNDDDVIIGTILPMFRTILVGYNIPGVVNNGTDLIESVFEYNDVKEIITSIYSTKQFEKYNIIIEGDIVQPYINHMYIHHLKLKEEYNSTRDWLDAYVLSDFHIDRLSTAVTKDHFREWGFAKDRYDPKNYPWAADRMLYETCKQRKLEIYSDDLGDQPISKYPDTISIPRTNPRKMLMNLLTGNNVLTIQHYKTKKLADCFLEPVILEETKDTLDKLIFIGDSAVSDLYYVPTEIRTIINDLFVTLNYKQLKELYAIIKTELNNKGYIYESTVISMSKEFVKSIERVNNDDDNIVYVEAEDINSVVSLTSGNLSISLFNDNINETIII